MAKDIKNDFGAVEDDDFGAIDDFGSIDDPEINPIEVDLTLEADRKAKAAQAEAEAQAAEQAHRADPTNWSVEKTKQYIKENPPETIEEAATGQLALEARKSDEKAAKQSVISKIVRSIMRNSPMEQFKTLQAAMPKPVEGEAPEDYMKRVNKVFSEIDMETKIVNGMPVMVPKANKGALKEREDAIIEGGTIPQFEDLMTIGIGGGLAAAPLHTAKILALFTALEKGADVAGVNKAIEKIPNATTRDVADIMKFGIEGIFAGGLARLKPGEFIKKNFLNKKILPEANKAIDQAAQGKDPKLVAQAKETLKDTLEKEGIIEGEPAPVEKITLPSVGTEPLPGAEGKFKRDVVAELKKANADREKEGIKIDPKENGAQNWVVENIAEAKKNYVERSKEEFGSDNVISADVGKFAVPGMKTRNSAFYHEAGSALAKARERELLANKETTDLPVAFTAGGSGSGKSSLLRASTKKEGLSLQEKYALVHDTNMNGYNSAIGRIKRALESDRFVDIMYVYRDPMLAWEQGVIPRVKTQDRIVPISEHIKTHKGSAEVVKMLVEQYGKDDRFKFRFKDNSFKHGEPHTLNSIDEVPKFDYTKIEDRLYESTKRALEKGEITREQFDTALTGSPQLQARALQELPSVGGSSRSGTPGAQSSGAPAASLTPPETPKPPQEPPAELFPEAITDKQRKLITTIKEKETFVEPDVKEAVSGRYRTISNQETLAEAQRIVTETPEEASTMVFRNGPLSRIESAVGIEMMRKAQVERRLSDAVSIGDHLARRATESGQGVQALYILQKLSPEGILMYATRQIKNAREEIKQRGRVDQYEKFKKTLNDKDLDAVAKKLGVPHISEILAGELRAMAEKIQKMPEGREKDVETALMLKKISDLIPVGLGKKVSLVQTIAQLLNPKTLIRNLLGNIGFQIQEGIADPVAVALDVAVSLKTGKRSVYLPDVKTQAQGLKQGLQEGVQEATLGINLKDASSKFTLPKNGVFDKGVMGALEKTLRISLGAPDRAFYQAAFNQSIRDQVRASKAEGKEITEPTEEMIERAHLLGLYRTFQDDNVISRQFVNLKKLLNVNKDFGLGDVILKYPKTPANLLARGIEYSPFGFFKGLYELTKPLMGLGDGKFNQEAYVRSTARAFTGTTTQVAAGAILAGLGIISGKRSDDRDVEATREQVGLRSYQLNVSALKRFVMSGMDPEMAKLREDDLLINYDWMLPTSIGLALGANQVLDPKTNLVDRSINFAKNLPESIGKASETLQEQPLVQGIARFAQNRNVGEAFTEAFQGIPASFVPTILNQVRQLVDNTARNTKDPDYTKEIYNKAVMRIPGLSATLEPKVTVLGKDKEMYQMGSNNPFNVFLNPAFVTRYKPDPVSRMVLEVWEMSGQTVQFPRVAQGKIKLGSDAPEPLELTPEQYTEFQRYIGNKTDVLFSILAENDGFMALDDETKAKKLQGFLTDINTAAKIEVLGYQPKKFSNDVISIIKDIKRGSEEIDANEDFGAEDDFGSVEDGE